MISSVKLRPKDINKLSGILSMSTEQIERLNIMGLLNTTQVRDILVSYDWKKLKQSRKYKPSQIFEALQREYGISRNTCYSICYRKKEAAYYCQQCFKKISKNIFLRNDGQCDSCVSKSIEL